MDVTELVATFNLSTAVSGQIEWYNNVATDMPWTVPAGVYSICGVAVAPGTSGRGGGLHWRNDIPVTPGEILTVRVGRSDLFGTGNRTTTELLRDSVFPLIQAISSVPSTYLGGGGGSGGNGSYASSGNGAGGAGGYTGTGGGGGGPGQRPLPQLNSGGGRGGEPFNDGDNVGLQGRTPDFAPGSLGVQQSGGGIGEGQSGGHGGMRLMWGREPSTGLPRSYPDQAKDV